MSYRPPCTGAPDIERLLGKICEMVGGLSVPVLRENLRLRRITSIRTIQGSLAIEGNTLSEKQITAILEGKQVVAPPREIQEARKEVYRAVCQLVWDRISKARSVNRSSR